MSRITCDFSFGLNYTTRQKNFFRLFKCYIKSRQNKFIYSQFRKSYTFIPRVYRYGMVTIAPDSVQHKFPCNRTELICLKFPFCKYIERNIIQPYINCLPRRHHLHCSIRQALI